MAQAVRDVMTTDVVTCPADTAVTDVARRMRDEDIGDVIVTEGGQLRGIVTDRDIVVRCVAEGGDLSGMTVGDACSTGVTTIRPDTSIDEAARMMAQHSVRRLPVVEDGDRPVGIVSLGDLAIERDPNSALAGISAAPPNS
jgi:CBS domain-containing protein